MRLDWRTIAGPGLAAATALAAMLAERFGVPNPAPLLAILAGHKPATAALVQIGLADLNHPADPHLEAAHISTMRR